MHCNCPPPLGTQIQATQAIKLPNLVSTLICYSSHHHHHQHHRHPPEQPSRTLITKQSHQSRKLQGVTRKTPQSLLQNRETKITPKCQGIIDDDLQGKRITRVSQDWLINPPQNPSRDNDIAVHDNEKTTMDRRPQATPVRTTGVCVA